MAVTVPLDHRARGINRLDFVSLTLFALSFILFAFLYTIDVARDLAILGMFLTLGGFVASNVLYGLHYDSQITLSEWTTILLTIGLLLAVIFVSNRTISYIPLSLTAPQVTFMTQKQGGILIAIGEEMMFRYFLTPLFTNLSRSQLFGVFFSSAAWSVYHLGVYGTQLQNLLLVFAVGVAFAFAMIKTRRITPPLAAHIINNVIAFS